MTNMRGRAMVMGDCGIPQGAVHNPDSVTAAQLFQELHGSVLRISDNTDSVTWDAGKYSSFSVKSCYLFYAGFYNPYGPYGRHDGALSLVWKSKAPFKNKAFGWRILVNRLPTKDLLKVRGISFPNSSLNCVFCGYALETMEHIFFKCSIVKLVWRDIAEWIGMSDVTDEDPKGSFMFCYNFYKRMKMKEGRLSCIWLAITWSIWLVRNRIIFQKDAWSVLNMTWNTLIWRWSFVERLLTPIATSTIFVKTRCFFFRRFN
ncbi:uncharacterized protein LOC131634472 [Vicia villosa]|uniref:uncharacterized protein LOC131634472 n=1 Tax=Vicia villosa TaxID=3911 RepID=UPI00273B8C5F|nr:uncharacterized protein LOC131634472 [Vicia villosa]